MSRRLAPPIATPQDKLAEAIDRMRGFSDQMCQCSDRACANQVSADLTVWVQELAKDPDMRNPKWTDDETRQMTEVAKQLSDCLMRAMSPAQNAPPPTP